MSWVKSSSGELELNLNFQICKKIKLVMLKGILGIFEL